MWRAMLKDGSWIGLLGLTGLGIFFMALGVLQLQHSAFLGVLFLALGCLPIAAGALALYWRRRRYGDGPTTDEREESIRARGDNAGALALVILWTLTCAVPWAIATAQGEKTISFSVNWLLLALCLGFGIMGAVRTAAIWCIRRRELSHGQG